MSSSLSDRAKQRRRIVLTAIGAPAVLTLPSGAALAATSLSCKEKSGATFGQYGDVPLVKAASTSTDGWVRVRLEKYRLDTSGTKGFIYNKIWYRIQNGVPQQLSAVPSSPVPLNAYVYALVSYPDGALILDRTSRYSPISGASCWNSLAGTTAVAVGSNLLQLLQ